MAATACNSFRPNLWRPSTCANCYRSKLKHGVLARSASPQPVQPPPSSDRTSMGREPLRARSQSYKETTNDGFSGERKQVGVVKPYAVVEVPPDMEDTNHKRQTFSGLIRKGSGIITPKRKAPAPPPAKAEKPKLKKLPSPHPVRRNSAMKRSSTNQKQNVNSTDAEIVTKHRNRSATVVNQPTEPKVTSLSQTQHRSRSVSVSIGDKPAMSPIQCGTPSLQTSARSNSGTSSESAPSKRSSATPSTGNSPKTTKQCTTSVNSPHSSPRLRRHAMTASPGVNTTRKAPPRKPPRTLSTFINLSDKDTVPQHSNDHQTSSTGPPAGHMTGHERMGSSSSVLQSCVFVSPGQLHSRILQLHNETLQRVYSEGVEHLLCKNELWRVQWSELGAIKDSTLNYKGIPLSLEAFPQEMAEGTEREVQLSKGLCPHLNLSLVRSVLPPHASQPHTSNYILRDSINGGLLIDRLARKRSTLSPEEYNELVLLSLVQVLSAVKHIHSMGVTHRDVGLDSLYVTDSEWLVRLGNFNYALCRNGDVSLNTFTYSYNELKWLGGADSRLPPEVMHTSEQTQELDYRHTDTFAVGCLIHELLGKGNPFELDPGLIYREYTFQNLPSLPSTSTLTPHFQRLSNLLLSRDHNSRIQPSTALLITQALLWLPVHWLQEPVSEPLVQHHISYEKALLVASLAATGPPSFQTLLKAQFLLSCDVMELLNALALFQQS